ncbi:glycosyl hydrolase [Actinacidiphila acididurans]|uniref:Glycosyl hydrolase n=1 Tax=Actinacidiphila acididurans TaxID=2784346 RepID=A0ABS2TX60_9ACTN|nr:glycosyl hydrolase [Actinacidiphila acididurans]MBM9507672.1 glycosyl hydrolase [Actinacidiphila acididurans]
MNATTRKRRWLTISAITALSALFAIPAGAAPGHPAAHPRAVSAMATAADGGGDGGDGAEEADEIAEGADQFAEARTSPGTIAPGAFAAAWDQLNALPGTGGQWNHVTGLPYNSDDPRYRDYSSNSSGGAGLVTGRTSALAADDDGYVYEGSAGGGVWRSATGGGHWQPISDQLPTQATGALALDGRGRLWLGTGEATTNADAYLGSGVYVLTNPHTGTFSKYSRVGGSELDSTSIHTLRFGGNKVWASTTHGVWSHSTTDLSGPWKLEFAPNPDYLPGGPLANDPNAPYKNIANDVAIDPKNPSNVMLAIGWRSGDDYNGFYHKVNGTWTKVTSLGAMPTDAGTVGNVTFAAAKDGSRYYAIVQSPNALNTNPDSNLDGIYVSRNGDPFGAWNKIADVNTLVKSGSALTDPGYMPGVQAWYNEFLQVDPTNANHVYAGLEEVFETKDAGAKWSAVGPYWNFNFPCWSIDPSKQTGDCNQTTHADQHAAAIGTFHGKPYVYVGDDGGVYKRPVNGTQDASGHATDWASTNDGTIDTLQYYSVGIGKDPAGRGVAVNGGLQDNGQSILRAGDTVMGSNFGGDGGDTLTDPANGCNIAQEYVYLAVNVTQNCAVNDGSWVTDPSKITSYDVAPPDNATSEARFTAPLTVDTQDGNTWIAGGRHVWVQTHGYAIRSSDEWTNAFDLGAGHTATAVAAQGGKVYAAWCGPCNNQGFTRGIAVGNADGTGWHQLDLPVDGTVPNRYLSGLAIDPANSAHVYLAVNGFSRHWTEGPGAGIGHVFESTDSGATWKDISANLPDVPTDALLALPGGGLALATDLGVVYRAPHHTGWERVGNLPAVAVLQLKSGPDGKVYAATHGRGIWSIRL